MGRAIGDSLPLAIGVALSPLPIVAVVLMLVSRRARVNGPSFVLGWLVGLAIVGAIVLAVAGPADASDNSQPATWTSIVKIVLGALLLFVALLQFRHRPHAGDGAPMPKWMGAIDAFTPAKSLGAGALLSGLNPKNLLLAVAGATGIAQTGIDGAQQAVAYGVFALVATVGVGAPVVIYFALGDRSKPILDSLKNSMVNNNAVIMSVLCVVLGVKLIGDAIGGLST